MGVWDGHGHFFPAHLAGGESGSLDYRVAIPCDTPLNFQITTTSIQLADSAGVALPAAASAQPGVSGQSTQSSLTPFQHNSGDPNPKSFQFTVTGVKPRSLNSTERPNFLPASFFGLEPPTVNCRTSE